MLRITDARTGQSVVATPVRRGLTRVEAHASGYGAASLRVLLAADLLVRALELGGTPALALLTGDRDQAELRAAATALGTHPFEDGRDQGAGAGVGEAQTLHVAGEDGQVPDGVRIAVAPARGDLPALTGRGAAPDTDPAVLRLALLAVPRTAPVRLDAAALGAARDTLGRWRRAVADWARHPSRPVPDDLRAAVRTAWEDDLDVPAVLRVLHRVEDAGPELPPGARFETFAHADRLLGLELTRDLGAPA